MEGTWGEGGGGPCDHWRGPCASPPTLSRARLSAAGMALSRGLWGAWREPVLFEILNLIWVKAPVSPPQEPGHELEGLCVAWCGMCSHGSLFLLQRVRKDVDRGAQHSDMFLLKAEERREGMCALPGTSHVGGCVLAERQAEALGLAGSSCTCPLARGQASGHLANSSHIPSGA